MDVFSHSVALKVYKKALSIMLGVPGTCCKYIHRQELFSTFIIVHVTIKYSHN